MESKIEGETMSEQKEKALALSEQSGISESLALRVVRGKLTLNEAVRKLMVEERIAKLMEKHGISRADASKVAVGKLTLEDVNLIKELRGSPARQPDRNVLKDLHRAQASGVFCCFGRPMFGARVEAVSPFACLLRIEAGGALDSGEASARGDSGEASEGGDGEASELRKVEILLVAPAATPTELEARIDVDPEVAELGLGPSYSYKDRFRSSKRVLYHHYRDRLCTRVVFRDGRQIEGWVGWSGKWEFQLLFDRPPADHADREALFVDAPASVVIFRHAMYRLEALGA